MNCSINADFKPQKLPCEWFEKHDMKDIFDRSQWMVYMPLSAIFLLRVAFSFVQPRPIGLFKY